MSTSTKSSGTDSQPNKTNATARLSAVLNQMATNGSQAPVTDVLASVLKIKDPDSNRAFLQAFATMNSLLENSQKEVQTYLPDDADFYASHFQTLRACFSPRNAFQAWNTYKLNLTANDVTGIKHTAQRLKSIVPEYETPDAKLADIRSAIEEMSWVIDNEELSKHTRDVLRECLNQIEKAIEEFTLWGSGGLNQAFKSFTGTLMVDPRVQSDIRKNREQGGNLYEKATKVGAAFLLFFQLSHGAYQFKQDYLPTLERLLLPNHSETNRTSQAESPSSDKAGKPHP